MAPRLALPPDTVHVWHLFADRIDDPARLAPFEALLSPDERARQTRYARPRDRRQYLLARVLARTLLSHYLDVPPEALRFGATPYGKPVLLREGGGSDLHFNLTHSQGVIACAVSRSHEVGIDVEDAGRKLGFLDLAERYFAPPEAAGLRALAGDEQRAAFFAIWTLKEAFVKALGQGLTYPLDAFAFELDRGRLVAFRPLVPEVSPDWRFFQFRLGDRHQGAVAVHGGPAQFQLHDWAERFLSASPGERPV